MKTIVLDDDPTGTQSATGVTVLLDLSEETLERDLEEALTGADSVYVQTNSRALPPDEAVALARRVQAAGLAVGERSGEQVRFVLRGDSTLRGHVFAETEVFLEDAVMLFVPTFPDGGRTTRDGMHLVRIDGQDLPAHETEYAEDPVFGFTTGYLPDYVGQASGRRGVPVPLADVRAGALERALTAAEPGEVVLPDAVTDEDIALIARAVDAAAEHGTRIVVRSASPLAAHLAGVASEGRLPLPLERPTGETLLVCGSHTAGATAQLAQVTQRFGEPTLVGTEAALADPATAGHAAADAVASVGTAAPATRTDDATSLLLLSTERQRSASHGTLGHGERVMAALTTAVADLLPRVGTVISKGGITSAEVARRGLGARTAHVLGQILPGISAWRLSARDGRELLYIVVPGNVGDQGTLVRVLEAVGITG
ncbi:four-carbon acid sugar kinase family protein [Brachybacterium sp. MASK1Z-5]|uniref:Four-carbon acid sugar kinase family protein n=1 Tax=Brachybacterium halotolerans TaxID=2795215 RepID=A0ABS1B7F0_9MICO|nr:four-carbon acid sugar kinase family protein [Brachybacterium halotolerans]MBK0330574.1 four-carbon acid sugar kinase family protein [Brachybacterium halotolerans]